jgi:YesN/AraC family two-component response regulator
MVCHIKMPGEMDGIDLAYSVRQSFPAVPAILISGYAGVEAVKKVAATFDFLPR